MGLRVVPPARFSRDLGTHPAYEIASGQPREGALPRIGRNHTSTHRRIPRYAFFAAIPRDSPQERCHLLAKVREKSYQARFARRVYTNAWSTTTPLLDRRGPPPPQPARTGREPSLTFVSLPVRLLQFANPANKHL